MTQPLVSAFEAACQGHFPSWDEAGREAEGAGEPGAGGGLMYRVILHKGDPARTPGNPQHSAIFQAVISPF